VNTIAEMHRLLNLASHDAYRELMALPGRFDVLAPGIIANPVRMRDWHKLIFAG
jgi:hypothetical protein